MTTNAQIQEIAWRVYCCQWGMNWREMGQICNLFSALEYEAMAFFYWDVRLDNQLLGKSKTLSIKRNQLVSKKETKKKKYI